MQRARRDGGGRNMAVRVGKEEVEEGGEGGHAMEVEVERFRGILDKQ